MIAVLDLEGRRIYNSPSYASILGDPESLKGTDGFQEIHPDDCGTGEAGFSGRPSRQVSDSDRIPLPAKRRIRKHNRLEGSVIRDSGGTVSSVVVVSRDVTEEKKTAHTSAGSAHGQHWCARRGVSPMISINVLTPIMMAIEVLRDKNI